MSRIRLGVVSARHYYPSVGARSWIERFARFERFRNTFFRPGRNKNNVRTSVGTGRDVRVRFSTRVRNARYVLRRRFYGLRRPVSARKRSRSVDVAIRVLSSFFEKRVAPRTFRERPLCTVGRIDYVQRRPFIRVRFVRYDDAGRTESSERDAPEEWSVRGYLLLK